MSAFGLPYRKDRAGSGETRTHLNAWMSPYPFVMLPRFNDGAFEPMTPGWERNIPYPGLNLRRWSRR